MGLTLYPGQIPSRAVLVPCCEPPQDLLIAYSQGLALAGQRRAIRRVNIEHISIHAGESMAVIKSEDPVPDAQCELQAKENMLFASTAIANGSCTAVITSTGMKVRDPLHFLLGASIVHIQRMRRGGAALPNTGCMQSLPCHVFWGWRAYHLTRINVSILNSGPRPHFAMLLTRIHHCAQVHRPFHIVVKRCSLIPLTFATLAFSHYAHMPIFIQGIMCCRQKLGTSTRTSKLLRKKTVTLR